MCTTLGFIHSFFVFPFISDVQLKVLEQNFDRLRPFFQKDSVDAPEMYRTPAVFDGDDEFVQVSMCDVAIYKRK